MIIGTGSVIALVGAGEMLLLPLYDSSHQRMLIHFFAIRSKGMEPKKSMAELLALRVYFARSYACQRLISLAGRIGLGLRFSSLHPLFAPVLNFR